MHKLSWSSEYCVGHETIDGQHEQLFDLMENLSDNANNPNNKGLLFLSLTALKDYTKYHFKDEEQVMFSVNFPELSQHRAMHAQFVDQIESMMDSVRMGEAIVIEDLMVFLSSWMADHILVEDMKLSRYLPKS